MDSESHPEPQKDEAGTEENEAVEDEEVNMEIEKDESGTEEAAQEEVDMEFEKDGEAADGEEAAEDDEI